jgi:hypothetical protein
MLLVGLLATAHWLLLRPGLPLAQPWPVLAAIPVVLALAGVVARASARTGWDAIPDRSGDGPSRLQMSPREEQLPA